MNVKIGPYDWKIENKKDYEDFGETALEKLRIVVRENLPKDVYTTTLIHELLHAFFVSGGAKLKQEELVVDFLASQIFIFVRQNPEFLKYLQERFNS